MKSSARSSMLLLLLLVGFLSFVCIGIPDIPYRIKEAIVGKPTPDPLESELSELFFRYEKGEIQFVDISLVTSFGWDKLYIFAPYTLYKQIDSVVGISWRFICSTDIDVLEYHTLLVFAKNNVVVHCLEYPVDSHDFTLLTRYSSGIPIQEAIFVLNENRYVELKSNH